MKFTLTFTKEQLAILNAALVEMPYKVVAPLIQEINAQMQPQIKTQESSDQ